MPEELGGAGLGVTEAAIMMHTVASCGGGQAAASSIHINLFGPHAIVVHGTPEQKKRWLTPLIKGQEKACFGVTEPDATFSPHDPTNAAAMHDDYHDSQYPQDQAHGLRQLFAHARVRMVPVVANPHMAFGGVMLERLCTAFAEQGAHVMVVDDEEDLCELITRARRAGPHR